MSAQLYSPPITLWGTKPINRHTREELNPHIPDHLGGRAQRFPGVVRPAADWYLPIKEIVDFVGGCVLLVLLGPVMLIAAAATKLTSPGPALYKQTRVGKNGEAFRIWKIRTMMHNAESSTGAVWSQADDPRITRLGKFLRQTHIDEFPQLFQILSGRMSLIGPRPERPEFVQHLQWQVPRYTERLSVKPGVTGLAQMLLPPDSDTEGVRRKVQCDLYYVHHLGPWMDARIMIQTGWVFAKSIAGAALMPLQLPSTDVVQQQMAEITDC